MLAIDSIIKECTVGKCFPINIVYYVGDLHCRFYRKLVSDVLRHLRSPLISVRVDFAFKFPHFYRVILRDKVSLRGRLLNAPHSKQQSSNSSRRRRDWVSAALAPPRPSLLRSLSTPGGKTGHKARERNSTMGHCLGWSAFSHILLYEASFVLVNPELYHLFSIH